MNNLIKKYIENLTKEQVYSFALMHNIILCDEELDFTYDFIKKNWQMILQQKDNFNIDAYKQHYKEDNFIKIKELFKDYAHKFKNLH